MFIIEAGGIKVNKLFYSHAEAVEWGEWNYKQRGGWRVFPAASDDIVLVLRRADANPNEVESWRDLVSAAADEIERLRSRLKTIKAIALATPYRPDGTIDRIVAECNEHA